MHMCDSEFDKRIAGVALSYKKWKKQSILTNNSAPHGSLEEVLCAMR